MTHAQNLQVYYQPRDAIRDHPCVLQSHCILQQLPVVLTARCKGGLMPETDDFPKWGLLAQPQAAAAAHGHPIGTLRSGVLSYRHPFPKVDGLEHPQLFSCRQRHLCHQHL